MMHLYALETSLSFGHFEDNGWYDMQITGDQFPTIPNTVLILVAMHNYKKI